MYYFSTHNYHKQDLKCTNPSEVEALLSNLELKAEKRLEKKAEKAKAEQKTKEEISKNSLKSGEDKPTSFEISRDVLVYFRLTNRCVKYKHEIETVTAKTINARNGQSINVNVFHCKNCDQYFINYEALQKYISKGIYPALSFKITKDIGNSLNEASKLMLYGYRVAEGKISTLERRNVLSWIIDSGLLTKAEIIKDLQFKVRYNGSKAGNEKAKAKWQDDIQFVSRYVRDNSRTINAEFVRK